jgi:hypothetical protein
MTIAELIVDLRQPRLGGYALFDFALAFGVTAALAMKYKPAALRPALAAVLPVAVVSHLLVGQQTRLTREIMAGAITPGTIATIISLVYLINYYAMPQ